MSNITNDTTNGIVPFVSDYMPTQFVTTEEDGVEVLGITITGVEFTMFYMFINIILFVIIIIMACRSGAKKAKEEKRKKRERQKEREERRMKQFQQENNNEHGIEKEIHGKKFEVQLSVRSQAESVYSHDSHSDYSERKQDILDNIHQQQSSKQINSVAVCCGAFVADIMNRSFIYSAFLVHIWDQGSDLGVIWTWFTDEDGKWKYLGWISIGILLNYRLFSAYSLRKAQRGWRDTLLQILDLQLFVDVFRSLNTIDQVKPSDSLYWIRAMEAVLESCLQILLQFVYLYQRTDVLVWLSLFGSMASVIFSLLHYTDVVFVFAEDVEAHNFCHKIWLGLKWYIAYISRFLFRLCEVTSRCMVLALIWSTWNNEEHTELTGVYIVAAIYAFEFVFYIFLTQMRIPPWEILAFLVVNIDLTLTFEGRAGALTKPLRHNPFYICVCKPVAEMFTHVTDETVAFFYEHHSRTDTTKHVQNNTQPWNIKNAKHKVDPERQKLLIAPAHYVYRFLESIFQLFCVTTYAVIDPDIFDRLYTQWWIVAIATLTTILTPILYCTVRAFADESKTLERNLIAMVHHGNETNEIIKLIGAGASLKQTDYEGNSIVHACISKNNHELLARIIRKYKKDKSTVQLDSPNKKGYTPALLACKYGSIDCLKLLSHVEHIDFNQIHVLNGQSMIHIATEYDQYDTIDYVCHLGNEKCDIHSTFSLVTQQSKHEINGYNAIHVAARHNSVRSLDILIHKKVDFRAKLGNNDTAAIVAASRGHVIILQKLYDAGDYFDIQGNFGHTPLYRAALNNHPGTVLVLGRDFSANANIPDENHVHVVAQAFKSTTFGVLQALAELGCRFDHAGCGKYLEMEITKQKGDHDDKLTALMWACKYDYPKLVKTLLDSGANKNHVNKWDETASHHAAAMGNLDCLVILYKYGANLDLANGANQTPKDKAIQQGKRNVVDWFNDKYKK